MQIQCNTFHVQLIPRCFDQMTIISSVFRIMQAVFSKRLELNFSVNLLIQNAWPFSDDNGIQINQLITH